MRNFFKRPLDKASSNQQFDLLVDEVQATCERLLEPEDSSAPDAAVAELKGLLKKVRATAGLDKTERTTTEALVNDTAGVVLMQAERWPQALTYFERARPLYESLPDQEPLVENLANMGRVCFLQGETKRALALFEKALAVTKSAGLTNSRSDIVFQLGLLYRLNDQTAQAMEQFQQGLLLAGADDPGMTADLLAQVGLIYAEQGEWERSRDTMERALAMVEETGDKAKLMGLLGEFNQAYRKNGDQDTALKLGLRGLELAKQIDNTHEVTIFLHDVARIYFEKKDWQATEAYALQELEASRQNDDVVNQLHALNLLCQSALEAKDLEAAQQWAEQGSQLALAAKDRREQAAFMSRLADVQVAAQQPQAAIQTLEKLGGLLKERRDQRGLTSLYLQMGELAINDLQDAALSEKIAFQTYELAHTPDNDEAMHAFVSTVKLVQAMIDKNFVEQALRVLQVDVKAALRDYNMYGKNSRTPKQRDTRLVFFQIFTIMGMTVQDLYENKRQYQEKVQEQVKSVTEYFGDGFMMDTWTASIYARITD